MNSKINKTLAAIFTAISMMFMATPASAFLGFGKSNIATETTQLASWAAQYAQMIQEYNQLVEEY